MSRRSHPAEPRVAAQTVALVVALAALVSLASLGAIAPAASAAPRLHPPAEAGTSSAGGEVARIRAYWTPERMRATPPLLATGRTDPLALANFGPVVDATLLPYAVKRRIFISQVRNLG